MTESEAIKELHKIRPRGGIIPQKRAEALDMAIKALEKQIPKKVRYEDAGYEQYGNVNVYACICPSCNLEIIKFNDNDVSEKCESNNIEKMFHSSMVHHAYIGLNNYCNRCGQKLDWSDDDEID
jgi:hypothetical protein